MEVSSVSNNRTCKLLRFLTTVVKLKLIHREFCMLRSSMIMHSISCFIVSSVSADRITYTEYSARLD